MTIRVSQKDKTLRAFRVYVEIMDTAAWLRSWMHGPLELYDLTPQGFRLLILLKENGPTLMMDASRRMRFQRQNLDAIVRRLEERRWVRRVMMTVPRATEAPKGSRERMARRARRRWGVGVLTLTREGEKFVARVFPQHAKVVKALMRALDGREQDTLVEICRKLRAGAILKFISEITHEDDWESTSERTVKARGRADTARSELLQPPPPEDARETMEHEMSAGDWELVRSMAEKMRRNNVLKEARNVSWHKPPDEKRDAENAVAMLSRLGNDKERKLLERLRRRVSSVEVIEMIARAGGWKLEVRG
jgi:DNA-binding MarR family transcriptional regulator